MLSKRGTDYLAGSLLLGLVVSVIASIIITPLMNETFRDNGSELLTKIADDSGRFAAFISLDIAGNLFGLAAAVGLYMVFRSHDRNLALLGTAGFLAAAVLFLTGDMMMISLQALAQDFAAASGAAADSIFFSAQSIGLMAEATFIIGATVMSLGILSYGLIVLRTGAVPKWIGYIGVLGGVVAPFGSLHYVESSLMNIAFIGMMLALVFALLTGGWLIVKGSKEAAQ